VAKIIYNPEETPHCPHCNEELEVACYGAVDYIIGADETGQPAIGEKSVGADFCPECDNKFWAYRNPDMTITFSREQPSEQ
jgi:hypothetical protein